MRILRGSGRGNGERLNLQTSICCTHINSKTCTDKGYFYPIEQINNSFVALEDMTCMDQQKNAIAGEMTKVVTKCASGIIIWKSAIGEA